MCLINATATGTGEVNYRNFQFVGYDTFIGNL